jgi:peptidoglycan/LPS O-acetylase OafA/YrhL
VGKNTLNNFDIIRLIAASQVALKHMAYHLDYASENFLKIIDIFPGVPIFFFVSGFLIYRSFENTIQKPNGLKNFFYNRCLRLYPALIICFIFSVLLVYITGYFATQEFSSLDFISWCFSQLTFMQFYNPEFLRDFGVGALNGSLWSISVELQFYILTPVAYLFFKKNLNLMFGGVIFFLILNILNSNYLDNSDIYEKLFSASFMPWFYLFLTGALFAKLPKIVNIVNATPFLFLLSAYIFIWYISMEIGFSWGNKINFIGYLLLSALTIKIAFTKPHLSDTYLKRNDISYGIYIYHMPITNFLIYNNFYGFVGFVIALFATITMSYMSWRLIEKPSLGLKKVALRQNK